MKKYLTFVVALFSLFVVNTKAASVYINDKELSNKSYNYVGSGNTKFRIEAFGANDSVYVSNHNPDDYSYYFAAVCTGLPNFTAYFSNVTNSTATLNYYLTNMTCYYPNGVKGLVGYFYGKSDLNYGLGTPLTFSPYANFTFYASDSFSMSLLNVGFSSTAFSIDYGSQSIINSNQEIINQNKTIIEKNQEILNKQDEAEKTRKGILGKIGEVLTSIASLPKKLVELLIDALKSLFVPTDEQLYEIVNDSKELSENFGFVGEAVAFFLNIFTSLLGMVNANGCIEMPAFKIGATSLFEEHIFWEARQTCLADNAILSANIETIRTITSIAFVSLFLGFASRKFFTILSKETAQNDYVNDVVDRKSNSEWI